MNIVNKLTLRHLKENKGRTVVTALGITVSVAMITAVFVAFASFLNLFGELELLASGNYHARVSGVTQAQLLELREDERIAQVGLHEHNERSFLLSDRKSDRLGTGEIMIGDEVYISQMLTSDYDGTIPKNENEIAIEQRLLDKNELKLGIGDKILFSEGNRYLADTDGENIVYGGNYYKNEVFSGGEVREYTITAILHDNSPTAYTPIIRGMSDAEKADNVNVTILLNNVNYKSLDEIKDIIAKFNFESYYINRDFLEMHLAFDKDNTIIVPLLSMAAIILAIIMIASVVLIYNAFAMSISERVRYLGMLASVGATKKQKQLSVYFESFILGIVGIVVGICAGVTGIGITLKAIGGKIISTGMILGVSDSNMQMKILVPVWAIIGIVLVSAFTIFISSYIPSRRASKITPIDAIRQTSEIKIKAKKLRSSRLVRAVFGYEGELANKNLKRNGRRARVITSSIALSVILFICCNYFCNMFTQAVRSEGDMPYQVQAMVQYDERAELLEKLDTMGDIDNYYCINNSYVTIFDETAELHKIFDNENITVSYKNILSNGATIFLNTIDDEAFNELCKANGIDYNEYYGDEYKVLLMNSFSKKKGSPKVFTDNAIGCDVSDLFSSENEKIIIGSFIDYDEALTACRLNPANTISVYEPMSQYIKFHQMSINAVDQYGEKYSFAYMLGIETSKHAEVTEALQDFMSSGDFSSYYTHDISKSMQTLMTISYIIQVLVYGFIALITLITVFNIINTISTGVNMRKKEFAMLKSVGTTPKGFNKMIMLESAFYGLKALVLAIPVSIALCLVMYKAISPSGRIAYEINPLLYISVIAVVMLIIGLTMLYSVHKLKNDSIVETLKEEIN